ncbi:ethanolaminephosphotransferase, putative [Trypanosoma brucei gambiense DAL972]|uniref:Ethanolaminephosphotransferase, putative n=1 Tax=Trypanosoma brucei gambiense (strain MHOM/CI/86/DAL972) TaxID=679716 RepID=D0A400_TRYB9|nr:ethanolaminephosphotransferase, putative [Trypanosoma brucei gambiense DAL972]CBH15994.1 ethanolaminephosphotransferase, putative [Trypanosoma brucei gambiense DAL972]|eukprot:XP_011778258.1 ethanolaminephosphotransferase, putative [Trypanosoma brucei gambiense DAL972]
MNAPHRAPGSNSAGNTGPGSHRSRCISLDPRVHEHIPPHFLPNLAKYKYSGSDSGIISNYVMQPYWNFIVSLVPMTVAPNAITVTGFVMCLSSALLVMFFYYFGNAEYPCWVWLYAVICLFAYQTLDAIDGKQARRTNTGSPLGELFDHGCDVILTPFVQMMICCALNTPPCVTFVYITLSSCAVFGAIWEQFATGTLDLGYVNGPTDGILLACGIFLITAIMSPAVWDTQVAGPYEVPLPSWLGSCGGSFVIGSVRSMLFTFYVVSGTVTLLTNILHVLKRPNIQKPGMAVTTALPVVCLLVLHVWMYLVYRPIHEKYPYALELSFHVLMSYTATRMTVSRLCAMPFNLFSGLFIITLLFTVAPLFIHTYLPLAEEKYVLPSLGSATVALAVLGLWQYFHMILSVITQMAYFLRISVFSITSRHDANTKWE